MSEFIQSFFLFELPTTAAILVMYLSFLRLKPKYKRWQIAATVFASALLYAILYIFVAKVDFNSLGGFLRTFSNVLSVAVAIFLVQLLFEGRWYNKLLTALLFYAITVVSEMILIFATNVDWSSGQNGAFQVSSVSLGNLTSFVSLGIALLLKLVRGKNNIYGKGKFSVLQTAIIVICVCCAATLIVGNNLRGSISIVDVLLFLGLLVLLVLFYLSFEVSNTINKRNQEYALQQQRHELLEEYYKQVEAHQNEVRTIKHDMKNQLLALAGTIEGNDAGKAACQIEELVGQLSAGDDMRFTTGPGMNALLGAKYRLAQAEGIVCDFTVKLPTETGIGENDLAALVGNVLDNAIEACRYVAGQRYIQLKMVYHGNALVLYCENSTDGYAETATRKGDTLGHGKGLQSIRQTVEKYGGDMQYAFDPHSFSLELTMFAQKA